MAFLALRKYDPQYVNGRIKVQFERRKKEGAVAFRPLIRGNPKDGL
jgi:hypothetical protein